MPFLKAILAAAVMFETVASTDTKVRCCFAASSAPVQQDCPEAYVHITGFLLAWPVASRLCGNLTLSSFGLNVFPGLSWDFVLFWCGLSLFSR